MVHLRGWQRWAAFTVVASSLGLLGGFASVALAQSASGGGDASQSGDASAASTDGGGATYSGPPPYFFVRPPSVTAGLTPEGVHRVVMRRPNQSAIVQCYTQVLAANPHAHALVSVRLDVIAGGTGTIDHVHVSPANDSMRDCIQNAISAFEWPNPSGVPATTVDVQIDLAPTAPPGAHH